ncbi:hypothetical protein Taro_044100 [Colocasia esculenta]|uniref:Uncharacterized protein n=1 Tax=Colocasia esculenta TaxID=4460 RepID=A0A843WMU5_COLES|nr:hypothetical protein [Colocasia esculenta]
MRDRVGNNGKEGEDSRSLTGEGIEGGGVGFAPTPSREPPWTETTSLPFALAEGGYLLPSHRAEGGRIPSHRWRSLLRAS